MVLVVHRPISAVVLYPYKRALRCCKLARRSNQNVILLPISHHHPTPSTRLGESKGSLLFSLDSFLP